MSWIIFKIYDIKFPKSGFKEENVKPNVNIHCCVIGCHGNSLLHFGLNTKVSCEGILGQGGFKLF